ncbi:SDR family NAD(P)-dependent oxidoreductase [Nocardia jinanensis]|uniref:Ketoreductase domain-containing protein n=1 Tax=Nocardia jinanensis TaxID=382504 RepID=A0A917RSS0_9NOCA|nr:SDR family NAD(P)-dependent oxidoreductase [Nocardia jinanensis]GGL22490.1 hypothetical protein GCM10011588_41860 [Nocardia jinanensis]
MPTAGRTALVTGASEGIGRALARALAAAGYTVTGVARNEERLRTVIDSLGHGHAALVADLASEEGRERVVQAIRQAPFDVLINNAGTATTGPFAEIPLDSATIMMNLNCHALVALAHAFLVGARPGDALINVSSTLAFAPMPNLSVYCATKAFVTSLSESLWHEHKSQGVYVLGLCPGTTATRSQPHNDDLPAGLVQTPEQVAATALTALHRRKQPTVISGKKNTLFATAARALPRRAVLRLLATRPTRQYTR